MRQSALLPVAAPGDFAPYMTRIAPLANSAPGYARYIVHIPAPIRQVWRIGPPTRAMWRHKRARSDESPHDHAPLISQLAADSPYMANLSVRISPTVASQAATVGVFRAKLATDCDNARHVSRVR